MIQQVISRMANNSFFVKGWSLTLVAAIFAVAAQGNTWWLVWTALLPALVFWWLDTFYLRQERLFRLLYNNAAVSQIVSFLMDTRPYDGQERYRDVAIRPTIWPLHVVIIIAIVVVGGFMTLVPSKPHAVEKRQENQVKSTVTCNCPAPSVIIKEAPINNMTCKNEDASLKNAKHPNHCHHPR